jgi:hypothetical protein
MLPMELQRRVFAYAGVPWWICKTSGSLVDLLPNDPELAQCWFMARDMRTLPCAAGRGWWGVVKAVIEDMQSNVYGDDFGPVLIAAVHAGQRETVSALLSRITSSRAVGYSSSELFITVQHIIQGLSCTLCQTHVEMYRTSRAWASYFALLEAIRQGDAAIVQVLLSHMSDPLCSYAKFHEGWSIEVERMMLMSKIAGSHGNLQILTMLWDQHMLNLQLVVQSAAIAGKMDVWHWCLGQCASSECGPTQRTTHIGRYAATALCSGHTDLCVEMLLDLTQDEALDEDVVQCFVLEYRSQFHDSHRKAMCEQLADQLRTAAILSSRSWNNLHIERILIQVAKVAREVHSPVFNGSVISNQHI